MISCVHDSLVHTSYSFFFSRYGDHRDLHVLTHSFPTRRSSDLFFDPLELAVAPDGAFADLAFDLIVTGEEQGDGGTIARSGKSPVIFGRSADFAKAADKVIAHKRVRGGRMPPAPD